jgi:hypothetical protein
MHGSGRRHDGAPWAPGPAQATAKYESLWTSGKPTCELCLFMESQRRLQEQRSRLTARSEQSLTVHSISVVVTGLHVVTQRRLYLLANKGKLYVIIMSRCNIHAACIQHAW